MLLFASYKEINPHLAKFANKNEGTTGSREVPITEHMATTLLYEN